MVMAYGAKRQKKAFFCRVYILPKNIRFHIPSPDYAFMGPEICVLATWYSARIATSITSAKLNNGILALYGCKSPFVFISSFFSVKVFFSTAGFNGGLGPPSEPNVKDVRNIFGRTQGVTNPVSDNMRSKT